MQLDTATDQPLAGFADPVHDSQRVFRSVLEAMSLPGKIVKIDDLVEAPAPLHKMAAAICLSLVDFETPLWSDSNIAISGQAMTHLQFHCGCPMTAKPEEARTALISDVANMQTLASFYVGTDERPDLSTTVIIQVKGFASGMGVTLTGPGINGSQQLKVEGVDETFWKSVQANSELFPRGVDLILTADDAIVCLPRTTQVEFK